MNEDSAVTGVGRRVRMLAVALLLSVFVVPVLMWWQAGEARAQRTPVQRVATSRSTVPSDDGATPVLVAHVPAREARALAARPVVRPPVPGFAGEADPGAARAAAPPNPFLPEPAPAGWHNPPATPPAVPEGLRVADVGLADAGTPEPEIRNPKSEIQAASAAKAAPARAAVPAAAPARMTPGSGAPRLAAAPKAQLPASPAPAPPPTPLEDVRLRGIIHGAPDVALILLGGQTFFLKAGDPVTGTWVVADIKANSVVLRSGGHVRELQIEGGSQK